jgi:hypothetical protein
MVPPRGLAKLNLVVAMSSRQPRLAGSVLLDQMGVIAAAFGDDALKRAKAKLSPERQRDLDALIPISWIDVELARDLKNAVADVVGKDPIELQKWVVREAVGNTIHKFWRALLVRVWDSAIVKRTPIVYAKTFDRGALQVASFSDHAAELVLSGWSTMPDYDAIGLAAGIEAVLEYSGRRNARVRFTRKDDGVRFYLTWRSRDGGSIAPTGRPSAPPSGDGVS